MDAATLTAPGCNVLRDDSASVADPVAGLWGNIECAADSRHAYMTAGGDVSSTASGTAQGNDAYRRLTVIDGDDFWGERCELGRNTSRYGENKGSATSGTFALYQHGERRITFFSQRYPENFSSGNLWQTVMQMKQAQPADNAGRGPVLELQLYNGRLELQNSWLGESLEHVSAGGGHLDPVRARRRLLARSGRRLGAGLRRPQRRRRRGGRGRAVAQVEHGHPVGRVLRPERCQRRPGCGRRDPGPFATGPLPQPRDRLPAPGRLLVDVDNVQVVG